jgi:Transglutaminase-like superfamily
VDPDANKVRAKYLLARHAFVCVRNEGAVFLDLRNDRYFALRGTQAAFIGQVVEGWPGGKSAGTTETPVETNSCNNLIQALISRGLITTDLSIGKAAEPVLWNAPQCEVNTYTDPSDEPIDISQRVDFMRAVVFASALLHLSSLERTIRRVRLRNTALRQQPATEVLRSYISTFTRLRPYAFTARDGCLFESLVLSEFLAYRHIYPSWVFAIQFEPFAAHCWLQLGTIVLNDTVENVQQFNPIMVV